MVIMSSSPDKLTSLEFITDEARPHLRIREQSVCTACSSKPCLSLCPSRVFQWDNAAAHPVLILYKQCVECGACRLACPQANIDFHFPAGGYGVMFRHG